MGNIGPIRPSKAQKNPEVRNILKECYLAGVRMGCSEGMAITFNDRDGRNEILCFVRDLDKWAPYLNMIEERINMLMGFENYIVVSAPVDTIF